MHQGLITKSLGARCTTAAVEAEDGGEAMERQGGLRECRKSLGTHSGSNSNPRQRLSCSSSPEDSSDVPERILTLQRCLKEHARTREHDADTIDGDLVRLSELQRELSGCGYSDEDMRAVFELYDTDCDGVVSWKDLASPGLRCRFNRSSSFGRGSEGEWKDRSDRLDEKLEAAAVR